MPNPSIERLLALVCRELGAESARLLRASEDEPHADNVLYGKLPDGRRLAVVFASAPPAKGALMRRLQMLTSTFAHSLEEGSSRRSSRAPPARSLHEELRALSVRARAVDAAVIDAHSPVVWGCASAEKDPPIDPRARAGLDVAPSRVRRLGGRRATSRHAERGGSGGRVRPSARAHSRADRARDRPRPRLARRDGAAQRGTPCACGSRRELRMGGALLREHLRADRRLRKPVRRAPRGAGDRGRAAEDRTARSRAPSARSKAVSDRERHLDARARAPALTGSLQADALGPSADRRSLPRSARFGLRGGDGKSSQLGSAHVDDPEGV